MFLRIAKEYLPQFLALPQVTSAKVQYAIDIGDHHHRLYYDLTTPHDICAVLVSMSEYEVYRCRGMGYVENELRRRIETIIQQTAEYLAEPRVHPPERTTMSEPFCDGKLAAIEQAARHQKPVPHGVTLELVEEVRRLQAKVSELVETIRYQNCRVGEIYAENKRLQRECQLDLDEPTRCGSVRSSNPYVRCVLMVAHQGPHHGTDESEWPRHVSVGKAIVVDQLTPCERWDLTELITDMVKDFDPPAPDITIE